jgi:pyridoxine/pyridoxamine 5'-phosphate oxidase
MSANADSPTDVAHRIIDAASYMTLATADTGGRPWATPVWFAQQDLREFIWVSRPGTQHSRNIAEWRDIALVVFDSAVPPGEGVGVYVEAVASEVDDGDRADALAVYTARSVARGIRPWHESDVTGAAQFRLYRAVASRVWVLDEHDGRVLVA